MKIKIAISVSLLIIICLIVINNRTPFFLPVKGGWSIGYNIYDSIPLKIDSNQGNIFSIKRFANINDSEAILADPFFITQNDTIYLFVEFQLKKNGADIAVMKSTNGVDFEFDRVILDEDFHLSYPQVFKHQNKYFMLPETKNANNVLLYKAYNFPYDWRVCDTIIKNVRLKDPSIYLSDSLNFLVASDDNFNLFIYQSDSLFGKWEKHKDIVKCGSEARPGGRIFVNEENNITIPIQNSTHGYGYGLSLYKISYDKSGDYKFELSNKFFLKANKKIDEFSGGMHHLDIQQYNGKYFIVYDGYYVNKDKMRLNWKSPIKASYLDAKNYLYQTFR